MCLRVDLAWPVQEMGVALGRIVQKLPVASVVKLLTSSQAPELQLGAIPREPGLCHSAISNPLVLGTEGRLISFEQSCTDGQRCFGFDVTLANWKAFPKLRMVKSVMLTAVGVCHWVGQL